MSKHRLFTWTHKSTLPDSAVIAVARVDNTTFGILHSRFHELWSLRIGTFLGVGNDPRYTPSTTFETFPFPRA
ncbi:MULTISPECIES: type IIL restriction-modification enzyme MmeI [Paracoccus]|uniref:type IIL restriction-modification enzyme MmeI n=1 Tax=Paracoccus TaxID=265 RepID=UPI0030B87B93